MVKLFFSLLEKEKDLIFFIPGLVFLSTMPMTAFLYKFVVRKLYVKVNGLPTCAGAAMYKVMGSKLEEFLDKQIKSLEIFQEFRWTDLNDPST